MLINIISDIHDDIGECKYSHLPEFHKDADIVLYCGDMGPRFFREIEGNKKFFGVKGNHYYYDNNKFKRDGRVEILEFDRYVFLATTLWTDFKYGGDQKDNMYLSQHRMNDYYWIKYKNRLLSPKDILEEHLMSKSNLQWQLDKYKHKRCVVITHHAPSPKSIPKKYEGKQINCAYLSEMEDFIKDNPQIVLYAHGHMHSSCNYKIGHCRVVCNPRGYEKYAGIIENKSFNPKLIIEI